MVQERVTANPGLSSREVEKRLEEFGLNELKHKKKKFPLMIFLSQFNDFMVWVLLGATIISGIMGDTADAITIIIIVIVNAILGFVQEYRTERSLEALKNLDIINKVADSVIFVFDKIEEEIAKLNLTKKELIERIKKT